MKPALLLLLLTQLANLQVNADELLVIISGKTIHMGSNDLNENNYGLGLQYEFDANRRWIPLISLASLKDSNNNTSRYIGAGIKRRFNLGSSSKRINFDVGVAGLAMTRPDYNDDKPFLGAIPFVSISNDWGGVNATYVPRIEDDMLAFWYFQFSIKLMQL